MKRMKRMKRLFSMANHIADGNFNCRNLYLFKSSAVSFWYCQYGFAEWFCHEI